MEPLVTIQPAPNLQGFCQHIIALCGANWPPSEDEIAAEFVPFFRIEPVLRLQKLKELCSSLGIAVTLKELPPGLRGHNCVFGDRREIVITENSELAAVLGSQEHTLLHELREIMEYEFRRLQRPIARDFSDREQRADDFGMAVRVETASGMFHKLTDGLGEPNWTLKDILIGVLAIIGMTIYVAMCKSLPQREDRAEGRYIHT